MGGSSPRMTQLMVRTARTRAPERHRAEAESDPDIIFGCTTATLMARIKDAARFDQQKFDLMFGVRLVLDAFRDDSFRLGRCGPRRRENRSSKCPPAR